MRSQLKIKREFFFLTHQDVNHGPLEPKSSVLPMSYTDPFIIWKWFNFVVSFQNFQVP